VTDGATLRYQSEGVIAPDKSDRRKVIIKVVPRETVALSSLR